MHTFQTFNQSEADMCPCLCSTVTMTSRRRDLFRRSIMYLRMRWDPCVLFITRLKRSHRGATVNNNSAKRLLIQTCRTYLFTIVTKLFISRIASQKISTFKPSEFLLLWTIMFYLFNACIKNDHFICLNWRMTLVWYSRGDDFFPKMEPQIPASLETKYKLFRCSTVCCMTPWPF